MQMPHNTFKQAIQNSGSPAQLGLFMGLGHPVSAEILAVGRATDVTRNPVVLGDAVPPTLIPLAVNADMRIGAGFYARNFTAVNPHGPSSRGFAKIEVINM